MEAKEKTGRLGLRGFVGRDLMEYLTKHHRQYRPWWEEYLATGAPDFLPTPQHQQQ